MVEKIILYDPADPDATVEIYWKRLGNLLDAINDVSNGQYQMYVRYWMGRMRKGGRSYCGRRGLRMAKRCERLLVDIRDGGYREDAWKTGNQRSGPIRVWVPREGDIWPRDGGHRACILRVLRRRVEAEIIRPSD